MIVVAAAVLRAGPGADVLLTQRPEDTHLAGLWEFPGGKVEPEENPEDAVVRECQEEIGVRVEVVDILEVAYHRYREKDVLLLFYDCRGEGPHGLEQRVEHLGVADHAWVAPRDLERYELPPPDQRLVKKLRDGR